MAKNSIDAYGASGKTNVLTFKPESLHLVTDKAHPLYDERIHLPISEAMVLNIMDQGVLEPIIVWKDPETGLSCVVDGRQRPHCTRYAIPSGCHSGSQRRGRVRHSNSYPGASTGITKTRRTAGKGSRNRSGDRWHYWS